MRIMSSGMDQVFTFVQELLGEEALKKKKRELQLIRTNSEPESSAGGSEGKPILQHC